MSVHYKFKSNLNFDTVTFDGLHISVADLKKCIMQQKKIGKSSDFDLQITNAQTKEVYDNDEALVPKNTSVIVARVPVTSGNKKNWDKPELPLPIDDDDSGQVHFDKLVKGADLVNANASEDDKVKAMISQSSQEYDPSKYVKSRSMTGPLPPTYTCYRCGKQGHWIKNCPTNNMDVKRSTGIPRSFMVPVDGPEHKGALLTSSGAYAVPIIDHEAYKEVKKEKPPFLNEPEAPREPEAEIPEELLCMFCKNLLQDAVLIPCCGNSFCDECVRQALLDSDNHECPECHETDISPDTVIPNRFLRTAVLNFKNETGYTRVKKLFQAQPAASEARIESPQPSPDSTVESQPPAPPSSVENSISEIKQEKPEAVDDAPREQQMPVKEEPRPVVKQEVKEEPEEPRPGTPLADEPADTMVEFLPIRTIGAGSGSNQYEEYCAMSYARSAHDAYDRGFKDSVLSEPRHISTIETITNTRKMKFPGRLPVPPPRQIYSHPPPLHERANEYSSHERPDYHLKYDRRSDRTTVRIAGRSSSSHHDYREYTASDRDRTRDSHYSSVPTSDAARHHSHYRSTPPPSSQSASVQSSAAAEIASQYTVAVARAIPHASVPPPVLPTASAGIQPRTEIRQPVLPLPHAFPPQPPPPGASPIDTSLIPPQPPPPGVGPLLPTPPPGLVDSSFSAQKFKTEDGKTEEKSIDDKLEEFQRKLEERGRESRDRSSRSSSRSQDRRDKSRSSTRSSRSRSYNSSKSWSRSPSRSVSRSSGSRSRSPYSSRSRSPSISRSRSRSRSKSRSYTRSRSRSITRSRSRSRERRRSVSRERYRADSRERYRNDSRDRRRADSRERRRTDSRDRLSTPYSRSHSTSHSPSPRNYRGRIHRSPYSIRRDYGPQQYGGSFGAPYPVGPPPQPQPAPLPLPVMRLAPYPSNQVPQSIHTVQTPMISHPVEHYPQERQRYHQYGDHYSHYDMYPHQSKPYHPHPRYEREQRTARYESRDYPREFLRHNEETAHRIPGWVGDRARDFKPRYRIPRDQQRKEIKELPKLPEPEVRVKEPKEATPKRKEEKPVVKHKKHHHHHHHSRETKKAEKQESKIPVLVGAEQTGSSKPAGGNLISIEVLPEKDLQTSKPKEGGETKHADKSKEKKHKHKKHKTGEQATKKKKVGKKEKAGTSNQDATGKAKTKKKKAKAKAVGEEAKKKDKSSKKAKHPAPEEGKTEGAAAEATNVSVTAVPPKVEKEAADSSVDVTEAVNASARGVRQEKIEVALDDVPSKDGEARTSEVAFNADDEDAIEGIDENETILSPTRTGVDEEEEEQLEMEPEEEHIEGEQEGTEDILEDAPEDELHVDLPEISKWEREEFEEEMLSRPQRKSAVVVPKEEEKATISTDIIQRAEKVLLHKPLKTAIVVPPSKDKSSSSKNSKKSHRAEPGLDSPSEKPVDKAKEAEEQEETKAVVSSEIGTVTPSLQVTITADREKRSVQARDGDQKDSAKSAAPHAKRLKLDRTKFSTEFSEAKASPPQSLHRSVVVENWSKKHDVTETERKHAKSRGHAELSSTEDRKRDDSRRENRDSSRDTRRRDRSADKDSEPRDRKAHDRPLKGSAERRRSPGRDERVRRGEHDRDRHPNESRDRYRGDQRSSGKDTNRRRSRSNGSADSRHSPAQRYSDRRQRDSSYQSEREKRPDQESFDLRQRISSKSSAHSSKQGDDEKKAARKDHSGRESQKPHSRHVQPHDESQFVPDYDEFSDDNKEADRRKLKRSVVELPEVPQKRARHEPPEKGKPGDHGRAAAKKDKQHKVEKASSDSSSSPSSSSTSSDSESSDSDAKEAKTKASEGDHKKRKKSKHKKHKKHKHKHKKKKSRKSKQKS